MGVVYEAINDSIERHVAIKVLHPQWATNRDATARFFNEAVAVNRICHPGLVQISDYAQLPDGTAYLVMEFLDGESLAARVQRIGGRLSVGSVLQIAWQIADTLAAAHAKGIIHRDLKPDNVMLVADKVAPGGERAKLVDFGIAKLTDSTATSQIKTHTNVIMGTPRYMAPEQCRGTGEVTDKADVYSLGIMLYQLLSGTPPFVASAVGEVIAMHLFAMPAVLTEVQASIPTDLAKLVHSMLAKQVAARPTMSEVTLALEQLGVSERGVLPSTATGSCIAPKLHEPLATLRQVAVQSRHRTQWIRIATLLVLILVTFLVLSASIPFLLSRHGRRSHDAGAAIPGGVLLNNPVQLPPIDHSPPEPRTLPWLGTNQPSDPQVLQERGSQVMGVTPWLAARPTRGGNQRLVLKRKGFFDKTIDTDLGTDVQRDKKIERVNSKGFAGAASIDSKPVQRAIRDLSKATTKEFNDDQVRILK